MIIYLIAVVIFIKLAHSLYKGQIINTKQLPLISISEADIINNTSSIEKPAEIPTETSKMASKNSWLYPTDNFGKMEKGREL